MHGPSLTSPRATLIVLGAGSTELLRATLLSIRAQTERALEVVVIDEVDHPDLARSIAQASAPWVKILHAGDTLRETCLASELAALDAARTAHAVFSLPELLGTSGVPLDDPAMIRRLTPAARDGAALALELIEGQPIAAATVLFARDAARSADAIETWRQPAHEYALWLGLCHRHDVLVVAEHLARIPATYGSSAMSAIAREVRVDAIVEISDELRRNGWARIREGQGPADRAFVDLARALLRSGFVELEPYARELAACVRSHGTALPREPVFERLRGLAPALARVPAWSTSALSPYGAEGPTEQAFVPAADSLRPRLNRVADELEAYSSEHRQAEELVRAALGNATELRELTEQSRNLSASVFAKLQIGRRVSGRVDDPPPATTPPPPAAPEPVVDQGPQEPRASDALAAARSELRAILAEHPDRRDCIIFAPTLRWTHELFQRPHQLALELARQGDLVFFGETLWTPPGSVPFRKLGDRLYATEVEIDVLGEIAAPTVFFLSYNAYHVTPLTRPCTVYELIDELQVFSGEQAEVRRNHEYLLDTADVVVATAVNLLAQVAERRPDAFLCPNAVDFEHFHRARTELPLPPDLGAVLRPGRPVVGYYGALAAWLDYDLVRTAALLRPDLEFVLIGPDYDGSLATTDVFALANVHRLESRPYAELPCYLRAFDVATIPFVVNEITESTSPIKLFEYLAAGKPVLATAMRECRRVPETLIARDAVEFASRIDEALALGRDPGFLARSEVLARSNTWAARVHQLRAAVAAARHRHPPDAPPPGETNA